MTGTTGPFSVIVATDGKRRDELARLLGSLESHVDRLADVILVIPADVGADDARLHELASASLAPIVTVLESPRGASRQRNAGLARARGEYVLFPDDDSWLQPDTLERAASALSGPLDGIVARVLTDTGQDFLARAPASSAPMTVPLALRTATTHALILERTLVASIGGFDERIGPGAPSTQQAGRLTPFQGAEDCDLVIRCLGQGANLEYRPDVVTRHPDPSSESAEVRRRKAFEYSLGQAWLVRTHRLPWRLMASLVLRAVAGVLVAAVTSPSEIGYRWSVLRGRVLGLPLAGNADPWTASHDHPAHLDKKAAATALHEAVDELSRAGIEAWLTDGTLLGCIRERDFIQHDWDVDIAVRAGSSSRLLRETMGRVGFETVGEEGSPEYAHQVRFLRDGVHLDIYVFYEDNGSMWHAAAWMDGAPTIFRYDAFDLEEREFLGHTHRVPSPPEKYLETKYGPDWRTPRTDWNWAYSPLNGELPTRGLEDRIRGWVRGWRRSVEREADWLR